MTGTALPHIAIVGGTGSQGSGLALRWAQAGYRVTLGGRLRDHAAARVAELNGLLGRPLLSAADNLSAAAEGDIIVLTVPYAAQQSMVDQLRAQLHGKILIDVTVPLVPPTVSRVHLPPEGSAVLAVQRMLGPGVKVVSAFQNVSAHRLFNLDCVPDCDVLVCGDHEEAREVVIGLARAAGLRAWHAGPLANSVVAEGLTALLIGINRSYKVPAAGIRITGVAGTTGDEKNDCQTGFPDAACAGRHSADQGWR